MQGSVTWHRGRRLAAGSSSRENDGWPPTCSQSPSGTHTLSPPTSAQMITVGSFRARPAEVEMRLRSAWWPSHVWGYEATQWSAEIQVGRAQGCFVSPGVAEISGLNWCFKSDGWFSRLFSQQNEQCNGSLLFSLFFFDFRKKLQRLAIYTAIKERFAFSLFILRNVYSIWTQH